MMTKLIATVDVVLAIHQARAKFSDTSFPFIIMTAFKHVCVGSVQAECSQERMFPGEKRKLRLRVWE